MLIADPVRPALKENLELKHVKMFAVQLNVQAILFVLLTITVVTVNVKEDSMVSFSNKLLENSGPGPKFMGYHTPFPPKEKSKKKRVYIVIQYILLFWVLQ